MNSTIKFFQICLLLCGVFGVDTDEVKTVSVMEGESVTLNSDLTEIQGINLILWRFGASGPVIAQMDGEDISYPYLTEIFGGRLQLDQTGSLTIKNMRTNHTGQYKLQITRNSVTSPMTFSVTVYESPSVIDAYKAEMKSVSVMEGDSVTLQTDVTHGDELIVWRFGDEGKLIAKHDIQAKTSKLYDDTDERFRDRLQLDHQTGSLNITNTRTTDSGLYIVKISSSKQMLYKRFSVIISAVPDSGLSSGAVAGIVFAVAVLAVPAAAAAAVIYIRSRRSEREKQIDSINPVTVKREVGGYAVLQSYHEIKKGDQMLWTRVSVKESAIASMSENDKKTYWYDERFRGRLQLDPQTGSLIIRNSRKTDAGVYVLEIKSRVTTYRKYEVILSGEVETVSVKEGDDVTLGFSEKRGNSIDWGFGDNYFITSLIENDNESDPDGRFRDRLQLDKQKGSLTIKDIRSEHTGVYKASSKPGNNFKKFSVVFDDFTETSENESVITGFLGRIQRFCGQARIEGVFGDEKDEMKTLSVMEEGDLKLNTGTEIQTDDEIILRFGTHVSKSRPYKTIARFSKRGDEFKSEERGFKDRLQLDLTGPLTITITDFRNTDCGDYYVQITNKKKKSFKSFTFIVSSDDVKRVPVTKGESINLNPNITALQEDDQVLWTFGRHDMIIADSTNTSRCDERFKDRVKLVKKTGSLTISNSTTADAGVYYLQIIRGNRVIHQTFKVTICDDVSKSVSVTKGESIILNPTDLQEDDQVLWTFGLHDMIIADSTNTSRCDERFKDRVTLDKKTGSLTISNSTTADDGVYHLQIIRGNRVIHQIFPAIVFGFGDKKTLPPPSPDQPRAVYANDTPIIQKQTDSSGNRENDVTVVMPLLDEENEQEGMSSL